MLWTETTINMGGRRVYFTLDSRSLALPLMLVDLLNSLSILFAIPFTLYGKKFHPSRFMFVCVLGWGTSASAAAAAFNFPGLAVSRFCIGLFEVTVPCPRLNVSS